jgi:hypothetical protein
MQSLVKLFNIYTGLYLSEYLFQGYMKLGAGLAQAV